MGKVNFWGDNGVRNFEDVNEECLARSRGAGYIGGRESLVNLD